jgi:leucyl aminopeptidase
MTLPFLTDDASAVPIHVLRTSEWRHWIERHSDTLQRLASAYDFQAQNGRILVVPATDGTIERVIFGVGDKANAMMTGALAQHLPAGDYKFAFCPRDFAPTQITVAWGLGSYAFDRYKKRKRPLQEAQTPGAASGAAGGCGPRRG